MKSAGESVRTVERTLATDLNRDGYADRVTVRLDVDANDELIGAKAMRIEYGTAEAGKYEQTSDPVFQVRDYNFNTILVGKGIELICYQKTYEKFKKRLVTVQEVRTVATNADMGSSNEGVFVVPVSAEKSVRVRLYLIVGSAGRLFNIHDCELSE